MSVFAQQTATIKGKITTSDGKPANFVSVTLKEKNAGALTNNNGEYVINRVKPGTYTLKVSAIGLLQQEKAVTIIGNETAIVDFVLTEDAQRLEEVIIAGQRSKYKTEKPSNTLRLDRPLQEIPQNIQIVTSEALADQQIISMSDGILRNVSGATKLEHWGDLYTRVNARGSRVAAFRNGMNVTSSWGPLTEDMSFVDHVEFVKGPAGFMMSNGEPSGIYNVVTKKPTGRNFNGEVSTTLGSYDMFRTAVDLDGKFDKTGRLLFRLNLMAQNKNSFRAYEFNDRQSFAPVISYKLDEQTTITAEYNYQHAKMSNVGSYYAFAPQDYATLPLRYTTLVPGIEPTKVNDHSAFVNLQHHFNDAWKITGQLAYFNYLQEGSSAWPSGSIASNGNMIRSLSIWDAANESKFGQFFVNGSFTHSGITHKILGGIDLGTKRYMADWSQAAALDTEEKPFNIFDPKYFTPVNGLPTFDRSKSLAHRAGSTIIDQSYSGSYVQDEIGFLDDKLRFTLAGRYTYVKESSYGTGRQDNKFTPRFGISASITTNLSVYGLYDQSFVPQNGLLRSQEQPTPITGNNLEAGIKKDWFNGTWNTTLSLYRITKKNQLTPDPTNDLTKNEKYSIQVGESETEGLEFDLRGKITKNINLIANYAFTNSEITEDGANTAPGLTIGSKIPGYAKHNANAWLTYSLQNGLLKGLGVSGGFTYQGDRTTWTWGEAVGKNSLPDYFRLDAGAFWSKGKIKFNANVFNVLDEYLYSGSYYGFGGYYYWQTEAPRNYRVSVAYRF